MRKIRNAGRLAGAFAVLSVVACGGTSTPTAPPATAAPSPAPRPNIVVVLADDLDVRTSALLPRLPGLMGQPGLTFSRAYVVQSLCSPSRASFLTGQYPHNHGVVYNDAPAGGFPAFRRREASTVATWLKGAGYRTALVGKYMNGFPIGVPDDYVPPGWDYWYGHLSAFEDRRYYDYWVNDGGNVLRRGAKPEEYSTDLEAKRAVEFIQRQSGQPEPLFLLLTPEAPHAPAFYTDRHAADFGQEGCDRSPSFNESDVRDKPAWVRGIPPLTEAEVREADRFEQSRLKSMRAVEEELEQVILALQATGRLERTFIFYSSDNGLLMGEHRAVGRKNSSYEESIRVPLLVRGPGVPAGRTLDHPVLNIDLAPTIAELAGVAVPESVDGRSLVPLLRGSPPALASWRVDFLVEHYAEGASLALRTADWLYAELESDERELYDMNRDPHQIDSRHREVEPEFLLPFSRRIAALQACRGASCRN
ncbi:MAG TPA: sulfatase [Vicinamibacteria bacterium]